MKMKNKKMKSLQQYQQLCYADAGQEFENS
jgi:hypothetical protein